MAHGGKRENAGRKKGIRNIKTLERVKVFAVYQQRILRIADNLFNAQLSLALGLAYLYRVEKIKKKVELITDEETIRAYLEGEIKSNERFEYYFITVKEPNLKAIESLLDRTFGKPTQSIDISSQGRPIPLLGNTRQKS